MVTVHPLKRIQVFAVAATFLGLVLAAGAEPWVPARSSDTSVVAADSVERVDAPVRNETTRRNWRAQLPAVFVLRRARST